MKYYTGGLEPSKKDNVHKIKDGNSTYIFDNVFKTKVRDMFIDWGTYQEIFKDVANDNNTCKTISYVLEYTTILIGLSDKETIKDSSVNKMLNDLYFKSNEKHLMCMIESFMLYEPVTITSRILFFKVKNHYEKLIITFMKAKHKHENTKFDESKFTKYYNGVNSSSPLLLYMNPKNAKSNGMDIMDFNAEFKDKVMQKKYKAKYKKFDKKIKKFCYSGYCPLVYKERLDILMEFPLNEMISLILMLDSKYKPANYSKINKYAVSIGKVKKPKISAIKREKPPERINNKILSMWYINSILDLRKALVKSGKNMELFYIKTAKNIEKFNMYLTSINF